MDSHDTDKQPSPQGRGGSVDPQVKSLGSEDALEEEIDRDIDESFPASDPPGWVMGTESGYDSRKKEARSMEPKRLEGKTVAILVADGFEQVELTEPKKALEQAGATTRIVSPASGQVQGWSHDEKAEALSVDVPLAQADPAQFDALLLPGGVKNPDKLRTIPAAIDFVKAFFEHHKPVAAICHGPWVLVEAGVVRGRELTSWPSLQTDIRNAGASWVDQEVVSDNGLITSRKPDDIPAFNAKIVEEFAQEFHAHCNKTKVSHKEYEPGPGDLGIREPTPRDADTAEQHVMTDALNERSDITL